MRAISRYMSQRFAMFLCTVIFFSIVRCVLFSSKYAAVYEEENAFHGFSCLIFANN